MRILFIRSAPLNLTPAVERHVAFLRQGGFDGEIHGLELDFQSNRPPVHFVDDLVSFRASYRNTMERAWMLLRWQLVQLRDLWRRKPDVIQFCDVFSAIPALIMKWTRGAVLIFDVRDPAAPSMRHLGRLVSSAAGSLEAFAAARSDVVVMVSRALKDHLPPDTQTRTVVLPNAPPADLYQGPRFSADGNVRVSLAGFISHRRNLEAWCSLARAEPDVLLDLYGAVYDDQTREILARHRRETPEVLTAAQALARMIDSDAVSVMYDPTIEINRWAAPNKFFDALMLAKPVVCAKDMHLAEEVESAGCGIAVTYGDERDLSRAISVLRVPEVRMRMGMAARRLFEERYLGAPHHARAEIYRRAGVLPAVPHG
jgi:glycosyltransferase involved in cell wall biosynthesis